MSYDLFVFEREAAPRDPADFMRWFDVLTQWEGDHDFDDPATASPALQDWYREMIVDWPAMNGPDAISDDDLTDSVTDYCITPAAIYFGFRWSEAEDAYRATLATAAKHRLGFYDVSGAGDVWLPTGAGGYEIVMRIGN